MRSAEARRPRQSTACRNTERHPARACPIALHTGGSQQAVNNLFEGVRGRIFLKRLYFLRSRWQADKIHSRSPNAGVLLSAGRAGCNPACSSRARTNASTGDRTHARLFTCGTGGSVTGRKDQNARCSGVIEYLLATTVFGEPDPFPQTAPFRTHDSTIAISSSCSLPVGGIFMASPYRIALTSLLSSGLPGTEHRAACTAPHHAVVVIHPQAAWTRFGVTRIAFADKQWPEFWSQRIRPPWRVVIRCTKPRIIQIATPTKRRTRRSIPIELHHGRSATVNTSVSNK